MNNKKISTIISVLAVVLAAFAVVLVLKYVGEKANDSFLISAKDAVCRAAVSCYAIEGIYPADLEYLKNHYGLALNEKKYVVHYKAFASNIMPEIDVIAIK